MTSSHLTVSALVSAFLGLAPIAAQHDRDESRTSTQGPAVAFLDAAGEVVYTVRQSEDLDAEGLQRALWVSQLYERFDAAAATDPAAAEARAWMEARWNGLGRAPRAAADVAAPGAAETTPGPRAVEGEFVIEGDVSAALESGTFVLFQPVEKAGAKGAAPMGGATMGAATRGAATATQKGETDRVPGEIARAQLVEGRFSVRGHVDDVRPVYFYILDAQTKDGRRMAPTKGQGFLLEPGRLTLTMDDRHKHAVTGGYFNDAVYGFWQGSAAYRDLQALLPLAFRQVAGESEADRARFQQIGMAAQSALFEVETEGRKHIALEHPDVLVRQLVLETAWLGGPWILEGARGIVALDPDNAWANAYVERAQANAASQGGGAPGEIGSRYLPFRAESLGGESVSLSETCAANRYVLLEFWASWCGPCRGEIPYLEKAYNRFHAQGFEIFAYTLDDERARWAKASEQEGLRWIDTGLGAKSDPVLLYAVSGVPANFLIDGATGRIVARNLRGDALEKKLEALMGSAPEQGK